MSERITPAREHQPAAVHEHQAPAPERTHSLEQQQHEHAQQVFGDLRSKLEENIQPAAASDCQTAGGGANQCHPNCYQRAGCLEPVPGR